MGTIPAPNIFADSQAIAQAPQNALAEYARVAQLKQQTAASQQTQQLEAQEAQQKQAAMQRAMQDRDALTQAMTEYDPQKNKPEEVTQMILKHGGSGDLAKQYQASLIDQMDKTSQMHLRDAQTGETNIKNERSKIDQTLGVLDAHKQVPDEQLAPSLSSALDQLEQTKGLDPDHIQQGRQLLAQNLPPAEIRKQLDVFEKGLQTHSQIIDEAQKAAELKIKEQNAGPPEEREFQPFYKAWLGAKSLEPSAANELKARQEFYKRKQNPNSTINLMTRDDAKEIADAIENGDQPPTLTGLYRNAGPVRAELARRGVPLAKMETDWKATQRYMATLNGPQQVRLRQSIYSASGLLDKVEGLYDEWSRLAPTSGFKTLNKGALVAMKNLPGRAGAVASALDTQISELTADLGNIYMGGNSPTDQALKLGAMALKSEWNDETFREGVKQAKLNVGIRRNSIQHGSPAGTSQDSTYYPQGGQQGGGQGAAKATHRFNQQTGKIEVIQAQ